MSAAMSRIDVERDGMRVPATLELPADRVAPVPAVLLLHGTASERDEVGGMFRRAAADLATAGIASLRIDFAGCGDSDRQQTSLTIASEVADAEAALAWLRRHPSVDGDRVVVLGFSQGGMIALLLAADDPSVAGLVTWSSGLVSRADRERSFAALFADGAETATADLGFAQFSFSRNWWDEFHAVDLDAALARFHGPVLAIAGDEDELVSPQSSVGLVSEAPGPDRSLVRIPGVDHIFNVLRSDGSDASDHVIATTVTWVTERMSMARSAAR